LSQPSLGRNRTVRVNFNSDSNGATVVRADGTVLGVTPLSTDVPYGNTALAYVIRMDGYHPRTTSIVPNQPSPIFAVLQANEPAPSVEPEPAESTAAIADASMIGAADADAVPQTTAPEQTVAKSRKP
jgi:hypothetical protein